MPRPAVVVQSDFNETHASVTICPITSDVVDAPLPAGRRTGLDTASQAMVDKIVSVPRQAIDKTIGRCGSVEMDSIGDALRRWLSI